MGRLITIVNNSINLDRPITNENKEKECCNVL
jgi:hypothetical protein